MICCLVVSFGCTVKKMAQTCSLFLCKCKFLYLENMEFIFQNMNLTYLTFGSKVCAGLGCDKMDDLLEGEALGWRTLEFSMLMLENSMDG